MSTNEFTNLLTDHILAKTPGGTILIDSPVNLTLPVDTISIKTDNIFPHTPGGNVTVNTNLTLPAPYFVNTNNIQSNNAQPILVNFGINTSGIVKSNNFSSSTGGGKCTFVSNIVVDPLNTIETKNLQSNPVGTDIILGSSIAMGNSRIKYGPSNASEIYGTATQSYFKTPDTKIYSPFSLQYGGFYITNNVTARALLSNAAAYVIAVPAPNLQSDAVKDFTGFTIGGINAWSLIYQGVANRLVRISFSISVIQSVNAGNPFMQFSIAKNAIIAPIDASINLGTILISTAQNVTFTSGNVRQNVTCQYLGPVATGDAFTLVAQHANNGATCTVSTGNLMIETISIGTD